MRALEPLAPAASLAVLSLLTAIALLLVVRAASDRVRIAAVKRSIRAALFEMRLFNDDLRAILRAQGEILRHNLAYLRLSLVPMLWVLVPLALLMAHLQVYYGYRGLAPGHNALVKVRLADGWSAAVTDGTAQAPPLTLEAPGGVRVETPRVWIPSQNEAAWRIGAEQPGEYELVVRMRDQPFVKTVSVSSAAVGVRSPVRPGAGLLEQWLHPAEPPLPSESLIESIAVTYPDRGIKILGADVHWMIVFFALTLVFAVALKGRFGVVL